MPNLIQTDSSSDWMGTILTDDIHEVTIPTTIHPHSVTPSHFNTKQRCSLCESVAISPPLSSSLPSPKVFTTPYLTSSPWPLPSGPIQALQGGLVDKGNRDTTKAAYHPYQRPSANYGRRKSPTVTHEPDVSKLQARCLHEGGDPKVVELLPRVFCDGVTLDALMRLQTRNEVAQEVFGVEPGPVYLAFLEKQKDGESIAGRYCCLLCPRDAGLWWRHHRDALRHLKKEHFGTGHSCHEWCVVSSLSAISTEPPDFQW
jgi:hypothetical protein